MQICSTGSGSTSYKINFHFDSGCEQGYIMNIENLRCYDLAESSEYGDFNYIRLLNTLIEFKTSKLEDKCVGRPTFTINMNTGLVLYFYTNKLVELMVYNHCVNVSIQIDGLYRTIQSIKLVRYEEL
jgi:hypothetical protein